MDTTREQAATAPRRWGKALAAFLLAFGLACAPLSAAALDGNGSIGAASSSAALSAADGLALDAAEGGNASAAVSVDDLPQDQGAVLPEAAFGTSAEPSAPAPGSSAPAPDAADDATYSMTFYYCEVVYYDDPDFDHPSNLRVLGSRTVEGLHEGDVLDTWDYVVPIEGFTFFDAWPAKPVVTTDNEANGVQLHYMRSNREECTVNYYALTDGQEQPAQDVAQVDGVSIGFEKMGSFQMENQLFDREVTGPSVAASLPGMMYVDSYPQSIRLSTDADDNVINLFYATSVATLPDEVPVPSDTTPPSAGATAPGAGDAASGAVAGSGDAVTTQASLGSEPAAAEARLAQTGDDAAAILAMLLLVTGLVALGTAVTAWRHGHHDAPDRAPIERP